MKLEISEQARQDIHDIGEYTQSTWGDTQADRYVDLIEQSFRLLLNAPLIGTASDTLALGLRRLPVEHHVVFYVAIQSKVRIVRILHERQLPIPEWF